MGLTQAARDELDYLLGRVACFDKRADITAKKQVA